MRTSSLIIRDILSNALKDIGNQLGAADAACIAGPLYAGTDNALREAVKNGKDGRKENLAVVLDTSGGVAEVVERMVRIIRHAYNEVSFIVPDRAMSAGTMLVMSGDNILMDHYSCLGPIDAQVEKNDGTLLSTASYLRKFEEMIKKSQKGTLTEAEVILLEKMDLGELEEYEQEAELAKELLTNWLSKYKFKNWKTTQTHNKKVTQEMRRNRANEIAMALGDYGRWHTHGRPIDIDALRKMGLQVENYAEDKNLAPLAKNIEFYFDLLQDYMAREKIRGLVQLGNFLEVL